MFSAPSAGAACTASPTPSPSTSLAPPTQPAYTSLRGQAEARSGLPEPAGQLYPGGLCLQSPQLRRPRELRLSNSSAERNLMSGFEGREECSQMTSIFQPALTSEGLSISVGGAQHEVDSIVDYKGGSGSKQPRF